MNAPSDCRCGVGTSTICARRSTTRCTGARRGSTWSAAATGRCPTAGPMSKLETKIDAGDFVVTAEMPVIDGGGHDEVLRQLEPLRAFVDAFNATDNPSAHAHCSPLAVALSMQRAAVEPILQLTCRDRNRLPLESARGGAAMLAGAAKDGLTGNDPSAGA